MGYKLLGDSECYGKIAGKTSVDFEERIKEVYDAIFVKKYNKRAYQVRIGKAILQQILKNYNASSGVTIKTFGL